VIEEIRFGNGGVCEELREILGSEVLQQLTATLPDVDDARIELAAALTSAIAGDRPLFSVDLAAEETLVMTQREMWEINRHKLDGWFSGRLVAGNRLELRDGLFTAEAIAALGGTFGNPRD
jgi:hypothetical protein